MIFEMPSCGGCTTCTMACSYHHTSDFNHAISSFVVHENPDGKGYYIEIVEADEGLRFGCDGCQGIDVPLCVEYCEKENDLREIINSFLEKVKKNRESDG